jgi:hypothetical protein
MKYINKIAFMLMLLVAGCLTSCDQDNEGPLYTEGGVTFLASTASNQSVPANNPTFTLDVYRGDTSSALTGSPSVSATVKETKQELAGCSVSNFSFQPGENHTTITVDVSPLEIGYTLSVTVTLPDDLVTAGCVSATSLTVNKEYTWVDLGKGTYTDNFISGVTYGVEIQKAEGFDRYRALQPYVETMANDDGEWGDWIATTSADYVEFWTEDDGTINFDPIWTGANYQGSSKYPIYGYSALDFGLDNSHSTWLDSKTLQLAPYYYINGVGGWNYTEYDGVIVITLP